MYNPTVIQDFAMFVCYPRVWSHKNIDVIKRTLPSEKKMINKLNEYSIKYPHFQLLLRTNIWRVCKYPEIGLSVVLPMDIWNKVDSYLVEYRLNLLLMQCKYIFVYEYLMIIDDYINEHLITKRLMNLSAYEQWWNNREIDKAKWLQEWIVNYSKTEYIKEE